MGNHNPAGYLFRKLHPSMQQIEPTIWEKFFEEACTTKNLTKSAHDIIILFHFLTEI